ncbi:hypothetical protein CTI14_15935 [Methylobacterium radiotolerans]|nr:hypothetical protein CTI14_15935 [Methylobacterium radiotolerans]
MGDTGHRAFKRSLMASGRRHSQKRVARLMKELGLRGRTRRRFVKTTIPSSGRPIAQNLLGRAFQPEKPDLVWASDITYIPTREGWLYLAVTMDLYARSIVGWAMNRTMTAELPFSALNMAVQRRRPAAGLLHHSDQGSQYTSGLFQAALGAVRVHVQHEWSGGGAGTTLWWRAFSRPSSVNWWRAWCTTPARKPAGPIFEYVEVYDNRKRRHSTLGYLTPAEAERRLQPLNLTCAKPG